MRKVNLKKTEVDDQRAQVNRFRPRIEGCRCRRRIPRSVAVQLDRCAPPECHLGLLRCILMQPAGLVFR